MAELSDIRCVLIDPNKSTEVERLIYRYYPIFYSGYVNSSNEVIFLAWDNIDKTIKLVEKLTLDIMYFPDMESSKVAQPYLIKKSQLNIPSEWGQTPDLSTLGYTKKSSLLYTDIDTIKKTYPKPTDFDVEESFYAISGTSGASQGGFKNGLEPFAFYGYASFDVFKTKNEFNKYKIYMNYEKNLNSTNLIHYECTCPTAKSPIIINLSSNDSITDNDEQNARACLKALEICNKGTCHTNETLPQEKLDLSIRECHDINDLMEQGIKIPCESTLSETPEHTIKEVPEITVDAVPEDTNDNVDAENTIPVLPENTKSAVNENTTNGVAAIENPINVVKINDNYAAINSTNAEWLDENNNKYFKTVNITSPFSTTALWFQNIVKRNIITNKQGGFITFKLLCIESWDSVGVINNDTNDNNVKIVFNGITLFEFHRNFGTNYTLDFQKNIQITNKNIRFNFKSNDDFSLWTTSTGKPAAASTWYSQSFNVRIDYPPYAFSNIELLLDGAMDEGWDNESVGISDFIVTQNENTVDEIPEATTESVSEVTNKEQPEITKPGNVEATRLEIPENTKPIIPASNITSIKNSINKYSTKANNYSLTKCVHFDNFNRENNWKNAADNSIYSTYMTVTNPSYGRLLQFLTHNLYKDYSINNSCSYEIHMDIFFIESWDSESYIIKINGTNAVALSKPHQAGISNTSGTAVIGGINVPWTFESRPDNFNWTCVPEYGNGFYSLSGNVKFKIPVNFGTNIRLGVTTTLDQAINDECAGLGNIYIFETQVIAEPSTLEDIQTTSSELSYAGKPEVSIDKIDKITVSGASEKTSPAVPESTKPKIPENTVNSVPENTKTFDCKDYQHCGEVLSPEVIEKTVPEIPEETQYKNETTVDGTTEATTPGTLENTVDGTAEKTTNAVPATYTPYVPPVISTASVPEDTTSVTVLAKYIAYDNLSPANPFIAAVEDGLGSVLLDGGFPKWYNVNCNTGWTTYSQMTASYKYLYDALNYISNPTKVSTGNKKVLVIGDAEEAEYYSIKSTSTSNGGFKTSILKVCELAGYQPTFKTRSDYGGIINCNYTELDQYCCILLFSTVYTSTKLITDSAIQALISYRKNSNGIFIITDHGDNIANVSDATTGTYTGFFRTANYLVTNFGCYFTGNYDRSPVNVGFLRTTYGSHPLWTNLADSEYISAGGSESKIVIPADKTIETTVDAVPENTTPEVLSKMITPLVPESTVPLVPEKTREAVPEKTTPGTLENTVYDINTIQKNDKSIELTAPKIDENTIEAKPEDTIQLSDCDDIEKQCEYTIDENPEDTVYGTPEITIPEITTDLELEKVIKPFVPESTNNKIVETTTDAVPENTTPGTPEGTVQYIPEGTVPFKAESTIDVPPVPDTTQIKVNERASGSNNQLAGGFLCKVEGLSSVNVYMDPLSVPDQFTIYGVRSDGSKAELYNQTWGKSTRNVPLTVSGYTHLQVKVNKDSFISGTAFNFVIQGDASLVKPGVGSETTTPQVPEVSQAEVPEVSIPLVPEVTYDEIPEDTVNTPVEVTVDEIPEGTLPEIPESTTPAHILEMGSDDYVIHAQTPEITNTFPCDDDMCEETIEGISENTVKEKPEVTTLAIPENTIYARNEEIELVEDTRNEIIESNNGVVSNRTIIENTTEVDKRYAVKYTDTKGNEDYYSSIDPLPSSYYYNDTDGNNIKLSLQEVLNTPYLADKICIENTIGDSFDISIASPENTRNTTIQHDELTIPEIPEETTDAVAGRIITLGVPENTKYVPCENQRICEDTIPEQEEDTVTIIPGKSIPAVPENTIPGTPAVFEAYRPERTSEAVSPIYIPEIPENTIPYVPAVYIDAVTESTLDPVPEITYNDTPEDTTDKVPGIFIPLVPESTAPEIPENTTPLVPAVNIAAVPENTTPLVPEATTPQVPEATVPQSETTTYTAVQNATQINLNELVSGSNNQLAGGFVCKVAGLTTVSVFMDPYGVPDQFTVYGLKADGSSTLFFDQTWGSSVTKTLNFNVVGYENIQVKVNKDSYVSGTGFQFRINGDATLVSTSPTGIENTVDIPESTTPLVPESTVPMVPAVTISNYVPETTIPEIPEKTVPLVPESTTPEVPETTIPEIPESTYDAVPEDTTPYKSEVILIPGTNEITTEAVLEQTKDAIPEITRDGSSSVVLVPEVPENTLPAIPPRILSPFIPEQTTDEVIIKPFKSIPEYTVPAMDERTINEIPENTIPAVPSYITPKVPESTVSKVPEDTTNQPITDYKSQEITTFAGTNTTYTNFTSFVEFQTDTSTKANWIINSTEAYQTTNNTGYAMLLSPKTFKPKYINISFNVPSTGDNDWLGFVFGYKNSTTPFYTLSVVRNDSRDNSDDYGLLLKTYNPTTKATTIIKSDPDKLYYGWKIGTELTTLTLIYNKDKDIYDFLFNGVKKFSMPATSLDMEGMVGPFSASQDNGRFKDLAINESDETTTFNTPEIKTIAEIPEATTPEVPEIVNPMVPPKYISYVVPEVTTMGKPESTSPRIEPTFLKEYKPESTRTFTCPSIERVANLENSVNDILDNTKHLHFIELKHPIGFDNKLIVEVHTIYDSMLYFDRDDKISLSFYYYSHNYNTVTIKPINTTSLFITPMDEILVFEFKLPNDNEMSITPKIGVYASIIKNREYDWQPFKEILTVYDKQEIYIPWKLQGTEYNIYYPSSTYSVSLVDSNVIEDSYNPFELLYEKDVVDILDNYNNNLVSDITNSFNIIFETEIPSGMLNYLFNLFMNNPGNLDDILKTVQTVGVLTNYSIKNDYSTVDKSFFNLDKTKEAMVALASNSAFETDTNNRNKFIQQPKQYMIDVLLNENVQTDINLQERIDIPFTDYVLARFNIFGHVQILKDNVDTLLGKTYYRTDLYTKYGKKYGDSNTYRFFNGNIQMLDESFKFVDIPFIQENYNIYKLIKPEYSRNKVLPVQKLLAKEINQIIEPSFSFLNVYNNNNRKLTFELTRFMNTLPYAYKLVYKSPRVNLQQNNLMSNHISLTYDNPFYDEFYELAGSTNTGNNITGNQKIYADLIYGQVPFGFIETILYHEPFKNQIQIPDIYNYIKFLFEKIIQYKPSAEILKEIYNDTINELKIDIINNSNFDIFEQCKKYILNYLNKYNFIIIDDVNIITVNNFYIMLIEKLNTYKDYSIEMFNNDINVINYWTKDKARQEHNNYKEKVKPITLNTDEINIEACLKYLDTKKLNTISVNIPIDNVITTKDDKIVGYFILYLYYYFPNNPIGFKYRRIPTLIQESGNIHKIANDFTTNLTEFKVI